MKNLLVIGGGGFLGTAIARALQKAGGLTVTSFDLVPCPVPGVTSLLGDLRDAGAVSAACEGIDTVFQTAALVDWGPNARDRLYAINVEGNRHVLEACRGHGVSRLVYTSSVDVVFDGHPLSGGDESLPIPPRHLDDYGHTKALAEADVLTANTLEGLQTCSLRATGIYGPGDRHRFPLILDAVRNGSMLFLGDGNAKFNHVYVDNLAQAHVQAAQALVPGSAVSGRPFFVTDHEPDNFYGFFVPFLRALELPVPTKRLPESIAYGIALLLETTSRWLGTKPLLTRYVVRSTCRDFWVVGSAAQKAFGYQPRVSRQQAFEETLAWLRENPAILGE